MKGTSIFLNFLLAVWSHEIQSITNETGNSSLILSCDDGQSGPEQIHLSYTGLLAFFVFMPLPIMQHETCKILEYPDMEIELAPENSMDSVIRTLN